MAQKISLLYDVNQTEAWTSWTPTATNLTVGNGTWDCKYIQIGKLVACRVKFTWGTTTSASAAITTFTLPVTAASGSDGSMGVVYLEDLATAGYEGSIRKGSTTTAQLICYSASGTYATSRGVEGTVPWTWANGDFFAGYFMYEAA